jgi:hypothetical protein
MPASEPDLLRQFNNGYCDTCSNVQLRVAAYVGGDHDEIAYCPHCGKHFGCWECDRKKQ